jgi:hypothetical protein
MERLPTHNMAEVLLDKAVFIGGLDLCIGLVTLDDESRLSYNDRDRDVDRPPNLSGITCTAHGT